MCLTVAHAFLIDDPATQELESPSSLIYSDSDDDETYVTEKSEGSNEIEIQQIRADVLVAVRSGVFNFLPCQENSEGVNVDNIGLEYDWALITAQTTYHPSNAVMYCFRDLVLAD